MRAKPQVRAVVDGLEICFINKEGEEIHCTPLKQLRNGLSLIIWEEHLELEAWISRALIANAKAIVRAYLLGCLHGELHE
jgi:hypothetical protein